MMKTSMFETKRRTDTKTKGGRSDGGRHLSDGPTKQGSLTGDRIENTRAREFERAREVHPESLETRYLFEE